MTELTETPVLFQFVEQRGCHSVGMRVAEYYDESRTFHPPTDAPVRAYERERARPLQTLIWYPAEARTYSEEPITVSDYVNLWATETSFENPHMPAAAKEWLSAMRPTLRTRLWAVRDAPPASGRFPVVIYAPSFSGVSWENADLCEYLASHGYLVLASPSMGASTREMTRDLGGINAQARDLSFLIGRLKELPNADTSNIAVIGFSWGGLSNVFAAARDDRITALVALDGALRAYPGLVQQAGDVHPENARIPLMSFAQRYWSDADIDRYLAPSEKDGPNILDAWIHGDLYEVQLLRLTHTEFSSMYQRNEDMWWKVFHEWSHMKAHYDRQDGITGYAWVARYTRHFLDAYCKHDETARALLGRTPDQLGVAHETLTVKCRPATEVTLTLQA